tara:strand:+ start:2578 stop:3333 length:756 start_codon:yes stop_codon:yes gene_type:complete
MSSYFDTFPKIFYLFGDEKVPVIFQKLTKYSDVIDRYKTNLSTYTEYEIRDGDRPDSLSQQLYGRPDYDWTFFLMNDRLREAGWPMTGTDVYKRTVTEYFKNYNALLDLDSAGELAQFADIYPVGQSVLVGSSSGVVVSKSLETGEITISSDTDSVRGNVSLSYDVPTTNPLTVNATLTNCVYEFEGTHHYVNDSAEIIDFFFSSDAPKLPVTNLEHVISENQKSKRIRIIKKDYIEQFVGRMSSLLSEDN